MTINHDAFLSTYNVTEDVRRYYSIVMINKSIISTDTNNLILITT